MTDILDASEAKLSRTPARFFFETGYFAAYAEASIQAGLLPPFQLTDAIIDRAWETAREAHPNPVEFDRYLSSADSADAQLAEAEATYRAFDEANREADGSRQGMTQAAAALRRYGAELFPANRAGAVHFARVLMDSVASVIDAALSAPKPTNGRPVLECTGIDMVEVIDADRAELERGLFTQGYPADRAKQLAFDQEPNDAALQMLARHRLGTSAAVLRSDGGRATAGEPKLVESMADPDCGCPEEFWDAHGAYLHMHLNAGKPSNAHADFGDDGEAECEVTAPTIGAARAAFFAWVQDLRSAPVKTGTAA